MPADRAFEAKRRVRHLWLLWGSPSRRVRAMGSMPGRKRAAGPASAAAAPLAAQVGHVLLADVARSPIGLRLSDGPFPRSLPSYCFVESLRLIPPPSRTPQLPEIQNHERALPEVCARAARKQRQGCVFQRIRHQRHNRAEAGRPAGGQQPAGGARQPAQPAAAAAGCGRGGG